MSARLRCGWHFQHWHGSSGVFSRTHGNAKVSLPGKEAWTASTAVAAAEEADASDNWKMLDAVDSLGVGNGGLCFAFLVFRGGLGSDFDGPASGFAARNAPWPFVESSNCSNVLFRLSGHDLSAAADLTSFLSAAEVAKGFVVTTKVRSFLSVFLGGIPCMLRLVSHCGET